MSGRAGLACARGPPSPWVAPGVENWCAHAKLSLKFVLWLLI